MESFTPALFRDCDGAVSAAVEPRNGDVWERVNGTESVHAERGYQIVVRLSEERYAPGSRVFAGGPLGRVPVRFTRAGR